MSIKKGLMAAAIVILGVGFGYVGAKYYSSHALALKQKSNPIFQAAREKQQRQDSKLPLKPWGDGLYGKMNRAIEINISVEDGANDDIKRLIGKINLNRSMQSAVSYQWSLPENLAAISGNLSGQLSAATMQEGGSEEVEIEIVGVTKAQIEGGMVKLNVWSNSAGSRFMSSASYSPAIDVKTQRVPASQQDEQEDEELALSNKDGVGKIKRLHQ